VIDELAAAYSMTGGRWQAGPGLVYDRLAEVVVSRAPRSLVRAHVLDAGAGTGAATRAALAAGAARVTAVDGAFGMLAHDARRRPPAAVADLRAAPFARATFDACIAAFSVNHLTDPAAGLREMARVVRPGGVLLVSAYAADDTHPAKAAVEAALAARGWAPEPWQDALRSDAVTRLATLEACAAALHAAGLAGDVMPVRVPFPHLGVEELVAWRLGMAQHAPFVASLAPGEQRALIRDAVARVGPEVPTLVRSILILGAVTP
jgi:SAM-dependent methyltransferase